MPVLIQIKLQPKQQHLPLICSSVRVFGKAAMTLRRNLYAFRLGAMISNDTCDTNILIEFYKANLTVYKSCSILVQPILPSVRSLRPSYFMRQETSKNWPKLNGLYRCATVMGKMKIFQYWVIFIVKLRSKVSQTKCGAKAWRAFLGHHLTSSSTNTNSLT